MIEITNREMAIPRLNKAAKDGGYAFEFGDYDNDRSGYCLGLEESITVRGTIAGSAEEILERTQQAVQRVLQSFKVDVRSICVRLTSMVGWTGGPTILDYLLMSKTKPIPINKMLPFATALAAEQEQDHPLSKLKASPLFEPKVFQYVREFLFLAPDLAPDEDGA
jgi:hypothetical protein